MKKKEFFSGVLKGSKINSYIVVLFKKSDVKKNANNRNMKQIKKDFIKGNVVETVVFPGRIF